MKTQHIIAGVALAACVGGGAFYGGVQYEKGGAAKATPVTGTRNFAGSGTRQGGGQAGGQNGGTMRRGGPNGGSFVSGQILSRDDKSLTVKTQDGGSTIVYFTDAIAVRRAEVGSLTDLATGDQVLVNGKSNADGSLSAETISLSPK